VVEEIDGMEFDEPLMSLDEPDDESLTGF
jgi:hypothetical protein